MSKFWVAIKSSSTTDARIANCEIQHHEIKVAPEKLSISVPVIVNTKDMDAGTVIKVLVESTSEEPVFKKPRLQASPIMHAPFPRQLAWHCSRNARALLAKCASMLLCVCFAQ